MRFSKHQWQYDTLIRPRVHVNHEQHEPPLYAIHSYMLETYEHCYKIDHIQANR